MLGRPRLCHCSCGITKQCEDRKKLPDVESWVSGWSPPGPGPNRWWWCASLGQWTGRTGRSGCPMRLLGRRETGERGRRRLIGAFSSLPVSITSFCHLEKNWHRLKKRSSLKQPWRLGRIYNLFASKKQKNGCKVPVYLASSLKPWSKSTNQAWKS